MCIFRVTIVGLIPSGDAKTFEFKPVKGRYVNIFLPGYGKYLTLCEVQVFAGKDSEFKCVHVFCLMYKNVMFLFIFT